MSAASRPRPTPSSGWSRWGSRSSPKRGAGEGAGVHRCGLCRGRRHDRGGSGGGARRRRHRAQGAAPADLRRSRDRRTRLSEARRGADRPAAAAAEPGRDPRPMPAAGITAFAIELVPRITRAQAMDVLSSQANLAGYKAVHRRRRRVRPRLSDDDDRGRHDQGGARAGDGRRRRRLAGDRHRAAARRHRLGDRCARRRQGAGRKPRRHLHQRSTRRRRARPRPPAAMPARWARITSAASARRSPRR